MKGHTFAISGSELFSQKALNRYLIVLENHFAISRYPANRQIKRHAGFVDEERHQCKINSSDLTPKLVRFMPIIVIEEHSSCARQIHAVFAHQEPLRRLDTEIFGAIERRKIFLEVFGV